jgi:hypothetical protein
MKKKETIINRMLDILAEANDLDSDIVDHHTFYEAYENAAMQLDLYDDEDEDGESDIYKFTYNLGDRYFGFYQKLKQILIDEGLKTVEQRKEFVQKTFVLEA